MDSSWKDHVPKIAVGVVAAAAAAYLIWKSTAEEEPEPESAPQVQEQK